MLRTTIALLLSIGSWVPIAGQSTPDVGSVRVRLGPGSYPRLAIDSEGGTVRIEAPPRRIVSLTSATEEYLYQIVPGEHVVGVSSGAYDEQFSAVLPKVKAYRPAVVEELDSVLALKPDLVLTTDHSPLGLVRALRDAGVPVFRVFETVTTLDQVAANILVMGYLTGSDAGAQRELDRFRRELSGISAQCRQHGARIFGVSMSGFSYGDQTLFHDVVRLVGGVNVASENGLHTYDRVDIPTVARWDPDWVFTWSVPGKEEVEARRWIEDPQLRTISAAKKKQVIVSQAKDVLPLSSLVTTLARTISRAVCGQ